MLLHREKINFKIKKGSFVVWLWHLKNALVEWGEYRVNQSTRISVCVEFWGSHGLCWAELHRMRVEGWFWEHRVGWAQPQLFPPTWESKGTLRAGLGCSPLGLLERKAVEGEVVVEIVLNFWIFLIRTADKTASCTCPPKTGITTGATQIWFRKTLSAESPSPNQGASGREEGIFCWGSNPWIIQ